MKKSLFNSKGQIQIDNIDTNLLSNVVTRMKSAAAGSVVARQFVLDKQYPMLITNVNEEKLESSKITVTVVIWTDDTDASYKVKRDITFFTNGGAVRVWEQFCYDVSAGKAIFTRDLLGNFFIGRMIQTKKNTEDGLKIYEKIEVDKFLGRIEPDKVSVVPKVARTSTTQRTVNIANLLDEDDEDDDPDFVEEVESELKTEESTVSDDLSDTDEK